MKKSFKKTNDELNTEENKKIEGNILDNSVKSNKNKRALFTSSIFNKHLKENRLQQLRSYLRELNEKDAKNQENSSLKKNKYISYEENIIISENAKFLPSSLSMNENPIDGDFEIIGISTQVINSTQQVDSDLNLGIDFGTSNVKVIIGDSALGKSFAVPFSKNDGISKYLLPSNLYESEEYFNINGEGVGYHDLKLSYLLNPKNEERKLRIAAFLALVIRRARGWLLSDKKNIYKRNKIFWNLSIGIPSQYYRELGIRDDFRDICIAAWNAANHDGLINRKIIKNFLSKTTINLTPADEDYAEIEVVPEIAAQIYGFVVSKGFDKNAKNIYLMADVGAGTLDASLFHVTQARAGRWNFEFFTSVVEPHGTVNLHRFRINWWEDKLIKSNAPKYLLDALKESQNISDQQDFIPESYKNYFSGVDIHKLDPKKNPDECFYKKILSQVRGYTYLRAAKELLLSKEELLKIPFFLCGGGARMKYYSRIEESLATGMHGFSYLKTERYTLAKPKNLEAPGIDLEDYDRLSVAYGLSCLDINDIKDAIPKYETKSQKNNLDLSDHYIGSEQI